MGGNLPAEFKISAQKNQTGVTVATAMPYENIPFVSLSKQANKGQAEGKHELADTSSS